MPDRGFWDFMIVLVKSPLVLIVLLALVAMSAGLLAWSDIVDGVSRILSSFHAVRVG